jgi:serine/threonine-protein kinase
MTMMEITRVSPIATEPLAMEESMNGMGEERGGGAQGRTIGYAGAPSRRAPSLPSTPARAETADASAELTAAVTVVLDPGATVVETGAAAHTAVRTTVLPRRPPERMALEEGPAEADVRYRALGPLGEGGVGEVLLVEDRDIHRKVAIKRLRPEQRGDAALLRFAEEVRLIGQLEHPGIVPVHDVGLDEEGHHFLVMKYVRGETLEQVIEKLRAGDPATVARFTHEYRARIFLSVLQAVGYAHASGIIHRDIKPSNIMVGPYGEVTVMDWGLAKRIDRAREAASEPLPPRSSAAVEDLGSERLLQTQDGVLLGTPLYMSPEQASGAIDAIDHRSDIYSLCVLFYELLTLEHPLGTMRTVHEVIAAVAAHDYTKNEVVGAAMRTGAPCEYFFFLLQGLAREPAARFPSVEVMEHALQAILDGKVDITCHITLAKRTGAELLHWIDRHAIVYTAMFFGGATLGIVGLGFMAVKLVSRVL